MLAFGLCCKNSSFKSLVQRGLECIRLSYNLVDGTFLVIMNQNSTRIWNVLCWNVRGLNAVRKWDYERNKVVEANYDVVCFQKKKETFDTTFIRKVLPPAFDDFLFVPSVGASGGLLIAWKSAILIGILKMNSCFALAVEFNSKHNDSVWNLMNVYGPCTPEGRGNSQPG